MRFGWPEGDVSLCVDDSDAEVDLVRLLAVEEAAVLLLVPFALLFRFIFEPESLSDCESSFLDSSFVVVVMMSFFRVKKLKKLVFW